MRNVQKRLAMSLAVVMVALGVTAASASAEIQVANPGQFTLKGKYQVFYKGAETGHRCDYLTISANVSEYGELDFYDIENEGSQSLCDGPYDLDDCGDYGWAGQIRGPGDEGFTGAADFEAVMIACFGAFEIPFELVIPIDNVDFPAPYEQFSYQEWEVGKQELWGNPDYELKGQFNNLFGEDRLQISEVE